MGPKDDEILRHIGRYRLSIRPVMDRVFFPDVASGCRNAIDRLHQQGLVRSRRLVGPHRYYQLTPRGAEGRVSVYRTEPLRAQAIQNSLGVLWFCFMSERLRRRLETLELAGTFEDPPGGLHCTEAGDEPCLYRVRVLSRKTRVATLLPDLREYIRKAGEKPSSKLAVWLRSRHYGFAVLAERGRIEQVNMAIDRTRLGAYARIIVEEVPGPQSIGETLHGRRISENAE